MAQFDQAEAVVSSANILSFSRPNASNRAITALDLVYQAADVFRGMEDQARETEARAQTLCRSATEQLKLAEGRAETAEQARNELIVAVDWKLQDAARALQKAQSRIEAAEEQFTAMEFRAQSAEARARKAEEALALVEEAIRKRLLCPSPAANRIMGAVA
jgi:hypothetical protein